MRVYLPTRLARETLLSGQINLNLKIKLNLIGFMYRFSFGVSNTVFLTRHFYSIVYIFLILILEQNKCLNYNCLKFIFILVLIYITLKTYFKNKLKHHSNNKFLKQLNDISFKITFI